MGRTLLSDAFGFVLQTLSVCMVYEEFGLCGFPASVGQECPTHTSTAARKEHGVVEAGEGREVKAGRGCIEAARPLLLVQLLCQY